MKLIFVYNASSGKLNTLFDIAHKIIKPETYQCSLCALTHNALTEKKIWSKFKENTDFELNFLHKDEFEKEYEMSYEYPVILEQTDSLKPVIKAKEINMLQNVEELIEQIEKLKG